MQAIGISLDSTAGQMGVEGSLHSMLTSNNSIMVMMKCNMQAINNTISNLSNTISLKKAICEVVVSVVCIVC
jgi:hypothetical protein